MPTRSLRQSSGLLRLLAIPTGAGQPVAPTLTAAAQHHPDPRCRKRLLKARTECKSENDLWFQLSRQRLISKQQGEQISKIEIPSLRAWALATLAEQGHEKASEKSEFLARSAQYIPIVLLGLFVGWIAFSVMQTLTRMIGILA